MKILSTVLVFSALVGAAQASHQCPTYGSDPKKTGSSPVGQAFKTGAPIPRGDGKNWSVEPGNINPDDIVNRESPQSDDSCVVNGRGQSCCTYYDSYNRSGFLYTDR